MHDLHLADKIHKLVLQKAKENNLKKVTQIMIELGSVIEHGEDINKENLEFNLQMLEKGTVAEGAELNIQKVKSNSWKLISISGN